jgi:uncharacterized iron-regulated membrane protein
MTTQILPDSPEATRDKRNSQWLYSPQRSLLRRAIFQIHLWVGIVVALYAVVIGVSGSILVFAPEMERALEPHLQLVSPGGGNASLQTLWDQLRATHPKKRVYVLTPTQATNRSASFLLVPRHGSWKSRMETVYFNPHSGEILGNRTGRRGLVAWVSDLHNHLLAGGSGRFVNGILGIGLILMGLSGAIIWWPGKLRWKRSLLILRWTNWKRFGWDLHSAVGFWSCVALLAVSFTGVYIVFPKAVTRLTLAVVGGTHPTAQLPGTLSTTPLPTPSTSRNTAPLKLDQIVAIAQRAMPEKEPLAFLAFPGGPGENFTARQYSSASHLRFRTVDIDPSTGKILKRFDSAQAPLETRLRLYFTSIHDGLFGGSGVLGLLVKILWVLVGLAPATLGITGLIMYWNRFLKPKLRTMSKRDTSRPEPREA